MATFPCLDPPLSLWLLLLLGVTCLCHVTTASRILLVPLPDTSQCRQILSIGRELHRRGHEVILFVPDYFRVRRCTEPVPQGGVGDVKVRTFVTSEEMAEAVEIKLERVGDDVMRGGTGLLGGSSMALDVMRDVCTSYMESRDDLDRLRKERKVDLAVVDGSTAAHCLALLPAYLGAPFVSVATFIHPFDSGTPIPIASYPSPFSGLHGQPGFLHRVQNLLHYYIALGGGELWGGFHQGNVLGHRVGLLNQHQLVKKASLYLENSDYIGDYPKANFPNFLQVGGLTAGPAKPLPGPLARFFQEAGEAGVVVVSLGPNVFTAGKNLEHKLLNTFKKISARVLLRLNATRSASRLKNVQTVGWFPQNDALGHPNAKLLVSLCGKNSFFEALYHGVPMLCGHFAGSDLMGTGSRVAEYGLGQSIDLLTASTEQVQAAITQLLTDKSVAKRVKAASKLYRSRPENPVQRAAGAIEHVMKYGSGYLRPRTALDLNFWQHVGLDVALFLFVVSLALLGLVGFLLFKHVLPRLQGHHHRPKEVEDAAKVNVANDSHTSHGKDTKPLTNPAAEKSNPMTSVVMYALLVLVVLFYIFV